MNTKSEMPSDENLQRFVDGELDEPQTRQIKRLLEQYPEAAQRVEEYQQINRGLLGAHADIITEAIPDALLPGDRKASSERRHYAIAASWLAIGSIIGWSLHSWNASAPIIAVVPQSSPAQKLAYPAMLAYATYSPEVLHPVEVGADQEAHLAAWLTKRLGKKLDIPDLTQQGYTLLGGRLLPGDETPAALFMYENSRGKRITLNIRRATNGSTPTAFQFDKSQSIRTFYWIDNGFGYALSGEIDKPPLLALANAVYHQLNL